MKNLVSIVLLITASAFFSEAYAQCGVSILNNGSQDTLEVPCGSPAVLQRDTLGGFALFTDFNNAQVGLGWQTTSSADLTNPCGPGSSGSTYLWMGNTATAPRNLTTTPLNLSCGAEVCFELRYSVQGSGGFGGSPCEGPDLVGEGVTFEYSVGGGPWTQIDYFTPNSSGSFNSLTPGSGDYTAWHSYCYVLPAAASVPNVVLRWQQYASTAAGNDHWGMDSITVENFCASVTNIWNTGDTTEFITTNDILVPTPYNVTRIISDPVAGSDTCYDSIIVQPRLPVIPVTPRFEPFCENDDAEVLINFNNAEFIDTSVTYVYNWIPNIFDSSTIDYGIMRNIIADTTTVYTFEHPTYPVCNFVDTVELLAGGVQIDSFDLVSPDCYRDNSAELHWYWSRQISNPLFRMFKDGINILPPPLDTLLVNLEPGSYSLVLEDARCADTLEFDFDLTDTIRLSLDGIDTNICVESPTPQYFTASNGTAPYEYHFNSAVGDTLFLSSDQDTVFAMYAVDALGCSTDTVFKQFIIPPSIKIAQFDTLVCPNIPFQVTAVASGGLGGPYNYAWHNGDSTPTTTVTGVLGGTYSVVVTDGCAERGIMYPGISIIPTPEHVIVREYEGEDPFTGETSLIEVANNSILLEEVAPLAINFRPEPLLQGSVYNWDLWFNGSEADRQYGWPVRPSENDSTVVTTGFYRYVKDGLYEVRLITTTEEGCIDTVFASHRLKFEGEAPNVITPNGDGINDFFYLPGSEALRDFKLIIYDRWGKLVFETSNPNLPENGGGWDGGDQNDGTYFYVATGLRGNGTEHVDKGTFTLLSSDY